MTGSVGRLPTPHGAPAVYSDFKYCTKSAF
jgi:hypothetical protein